MAELPVKACSICRKEYLVPMRAGRKKWERSRFCSRQCADKGQTFTLSPKICENCGVGFGAELEVRDWRRAKFCSRECSAAKNKPPVTVTHGCSKKKSPRPEYKVWVAIKQRCLNPNCKAFPYYGGRGISICAEWRADFAAFIRHIGDRPSVGLTVERIDNDRGYEPGNVRWATMKEQAQNKRPARSR